MLIFYSNIHLKISISCWKEKHDNYSIYQRTRKVVTLQPLSWLTSGSAMMMRILRSDIVVKLANRLLRTYSPGLLSGSMLMGIMAGGPFSPWGQQTGGMGGLLYPFPTGEAAETTKETWDGKQFCQVKHCHFKHEWVGQDQPQINWEVSKHGHKVPNMLNIPEGDCPKGTDLPWVCSFFPTATVCMWKLKHHGQQLVFSFRTKDVIALWGKQKSCACDHPSASVMMWPTFNYGWLGWDHKTPWTNSQVKIYLSVTLCCLWTKKALNIVKNCIQTSH